MHLYRSTFCCIDLDQLTENLRLLESRLDSTPVMAVLKANAYGHGAVSVMKHLQSCGISRFAVASMNEALELRRCFANADILILGFTPDELLPLAAENRLTATIFSFRQAIILNACKKNAVVHLKIDTGMNRLGFPVSEESADEIKKIAELPFLYVEGIYSHLAQRDEASNEEQHRQFRHMLAMCEARGIEIPIRHLCNGKTAMLHPKMRYDLVRSGSVLTGFCPAIPELGVKPAMSLKTRIVRLHNVPAGEGLGYDLKGVSEHDRLIATLPLGYGDGVPQTLSAPGNWIGVRGHRALLTGGLCMDMCMADVTDVPGVCEGDTVDIYGGTGMDYFTVRALTGVGLSNLQLMISRRVPRVYMRNGEVVESVDYL